MYGGYYTGDGDQHDFKNIIVNKEDRNIIIPELRRISVSLMLSIVFL